MLETLRSFRRNAVHIRQALELARGESGKLTVEDDTVRAGLRERSKRLAIPVRRALNTNDRASVAEALAALATAAPPPAGLAGIEQAWSALQAELDRGIQLGGSKVPQRQILTEWLEAAAFYDALEREHSYDRLIDHYGKAAEGLASELTEQAAQVILRLDEAAAAALDEAVVLPPPEKTPRPPRDRKDSWWRRLFARRPPD